MATTAPSAIATTLGPVVDFHRHWFPPGVAGADAPAGLPPALSDVWPLLGDVDAQLEASAAAGIDLTVVNAPLSSLVPPGAAPDADLPARLNDALALAVSDHGPALVALATVDAFAGDAGAREARRAVDELGLPGLLVDASRGELLLSDPRARPTLAFAAERGVPVFAHPVNPPVLPPRYAGHSGAGVLLARGSESALSTLALIGGGVLEELPGLQVVVAGIGGAALLLAAFLDGPDERAAPPSAARGRLHIDTMGFDAASVRFALDALGPQHVLVGSDWPIMWRDASRARVAGLLEVTGLDAAERDLVAGGNALRLLGRG